MSRPCKQCKEAPRRSPMVPFCSPACQRAFKTARRAKSIRVRTESPQRQRAREKREQWLEVRPKVVNRDERCRWCGGPIEDVHHVRYRSAGGEHEEDNLIALCRRHHDAIHRLGPRGRDLLETLLLLPPGTLGMEAFHDELEP